MSSNAMLVCFDISYTRYSNLIKYDCINISSAIYMQKLTRKTSVTCPDKKKLEQRGKHQKKRYSFPEVKSLGPAKTSPLQLPVMHMTKPATVTTCMVQVPFSCHKRLTVATAYSTALSDKIPLCIRFWLVVVASCHAQVLLVSSKKLAYCSTPYMTLNSCGSGMCCATLAPVSKRGVKSAVAEEGSMIMLTMIPCSMIIGLHDRHRAHDVEVEGNAFHHNLTWHIIE